MIIIVQELKLNFISIKEKEQKVAANERQRGK